MPNALAAAPGKARRGDDATMTCSLGGVPEWPKGTSLTIESPALRRHDDFQSDLLRQALAAAPGKARRGDEATMTRSLGGVPEWPKGTGCKPVGLAYGGSNPPAPIFSESCAEREEFNGARLSSRLDRC
jgi:hypothetical protein